ncbi:MAG: HAMP domain-containing histidine kinase [Arcobacter sp.]|nr:HAMP domain-containing histidine kinase [Arcobacter sp.]
MKKIIDKIFEPYFTTKHQSKGTGIGLYMTQKIITKHMNGTIEIKNSEITYQEITYKGTKVSIELPINL